MHNLKHSSEDAAAAQLAAPPTCDCETDPIGCLKNMFVDRVQYGRIQRGQCPARRPVFLRLHGVAYARLEVVPTLEESMRVGIFGQKPAYDAWVRFSSDIPDGVPDLKSTVGMGIKLFDVAGEKMLPPEVNATTTDFTFQNMNVFFVNDAHEMCAFTKASMTSEEAYNEWLAAHPKTKEILDEMAKVVPTVLGTDMWSVIPFHYGSAQYCKYKLEPEVIPEGPPPDYNNPDYLQADLVARLNNGESRFKFLVQLRTNPDTMPLDEATVAWSETESVPIHVATLIIPQQDIAARGASQYGENLAFNSWRTLREQEPVGSIAEARKTIYQASADLRRNVNGEPMGEPEVVRPDTVWPAAKDTVVVRAAIHPGIGVARIGNSTQEDGYFIGPEVTDPPLTWAGENRDSTGAIKRQAARFRIYGYNAAGEIVGELTSNNADIHWTAHLVNSKAQWYQFQYALDIPEAATASFSRRNPAVKGTDRNGLTIDPGPRTITGANTSGPAYQFDGGTFQGTPVPLGEVRTDDAGRLLVLGGLGVSASPTGTPVYDPANPDSFNNANGWYDDISDGPVTATVSIAGREIPVEASWAVVGPPNYAPDVIAWRSLYDLLVDAYTQCGWIPFPTTVSFANDVLPALRRLSNLQWVNKGFATMYGKGCPMDFEDPAFIAKLAHVPSEAGEPDPYAELRQVVFNSFRPYDTTNADPRTWPWIYGDAYGSFDDSPRDNLALSDVRSRLLQLWVQGDFVNDWDATAVPYRTIQEVPLKDQPAMLDKAALHFCLADAFHPGCEMTWPMRHTSMYSAPFRIRHRPASEPEPDYGKDLTQAIALQPGGPLYAQPPGGISRWMALPWQGDTAFCRSGYDPSYDPYLPTFWPARVPNQVLTQEDYEMVVDESLPREERIAAYNDRAGWLRKLKGSVAQQMEQMIAEFGSMGIVEARTGPVDDPDFPAVLFVESLPAEEMPMLGAEAEAAPAPRRERRRRSRLEEAGWESQEQLDEFLSVVRARVNR